MTDEIKNPAPQINLDKLARLAQLQLTGAEREGAAFDLRAIIAMIDSFAEADVGATAPMSHPLDLTAQLRPDVATAAIDREAFQALAPSCENGLYLVPQVIDANG